MVASVTRFPNQDLNSPLITATSTMMNTTPDTFLLLFTDALRLRVIREMSYIRVAVAAQDGTQRV